MRKTNRVRLFFVLGAAALCAAYSGGYYFVKQQEKTRPELAKYQLQESPEIIESGNILLPYEYILKEEDGFVVVYYADGETLYDETAILLEQLPWRLQRENAEGKKISSETELYNFLESYSS